MSIYQRILVPVDGSDTSMLGLAEAIQLAGLTGGKLRVMHAIDDLSFAMSMDAYAGVPGQWLKELRLAGGQLLERAVRVAEEAGVQAEAVLRESFNSRIADVVGAETRAWPADLIVLGTHGRRGISRLMLGSDAEGILRCATVPVLLVRPQRQAQAATAQDGTDKHERVTLPSGALHIE